MKPKKAKKIKQPKKPRDATDVLYEHVSKYLSEVAGWKVLVMGPVTIRQEPFANQFQFHFDIAFTGARRASFKTFNGPAEASK